MTFIEPMQPSFTRDELWRKRLDREAHDPRTTGRPGDTASAGILRKALKAGGIYGRGVRNVLLSRLNRLTFRVEGLPQSFDGFRILHLSDFHFPGPAGLFESLRALMGAPDSIDCDLCALTGDYAFNRRTPAEPVIDRLLDLLGILRPKHGFIAVPGNNDTSRVIDLIRGRGVSMLLNASMYIDRGDDRMYIAGVDDPHEFRCASVREAMKGVPPGAFTLFLAHSPEVAEPAAAAGANVYLCGHTHGGQICLPFAGPLFINARCPRARAAGPWSLNGMQAYTTRGLGASTIEVRYACPPDAALITLERH